MSTAKWFAVAVTLLIGMGGLEGLIREGYVGGWVAANYRLLWWALVIVLAVGYSRWRVRVERDRQQP